MMASMQAFQAADAGLWSVEKERIRGHLMFQCVTLMLREPTESTGKHGNTKISEDDLSAEEAAEVRPHLMRARKILLRWACDEYAPHFADRTTTATNEKEGTGAGPPNFSSRLDGSTKEKMP